MDARELQIVRGEQAEYQSKDSLNQMAPSYYCPCPLIEGLLRPRRPE